MPPPSLVAVMVCGDVLNIFWWIPTVVGSVKKSCPTEYVWDKKSGQLKTDRGDIVYLEHGVSFPYFMTYWFNSSDYD